MNRTRKIVTNCVSFVMNFLKNNFKSIALFIALIGMVAFGVMILIQLFPLIRFLLGLFALGVIAGGFASNRR